MMRLAVIGLICSLALSEAVKLDMGFVKKTPPGQAKIREAKNPKNAIEGEYIVAMKKGKDKAQVKSHKQVVKNTLGVSDIDVDSPVYNLPGRSYYKLKVLNKGRIKSILRSLADYGDDIDYIEPNLKVQAAGTEINRNEFDWFLDRIDQRDGKLDSTFRTEEFRSPVDVFVLDTGINRDHRGFQNRVKWAHNCVDGNVNTWHVPDTHGHGSIVAGLIASVSKGSILNAVKILDENGSGDIYTLLCGLDYIASRLTGEGADSTHGSKSVINLSVTTNEYSIAISDEMQKFVEKFKAIPVAAAGNNNVSACDIYPAGSNYSISVGCSGRNDDFCENTNYGPCVDILAPGSSIRGFKSTQNSGYYSGYTGTSFSTALTSGVIAEYLSKQVDLPGFEDVRQWLIDMSTKNQISFQASPWASDTPNRLLYHPSC
ncbi:subtilisin-like protease 1 [Lingula anatina]|uniref:Subtilisin-like protease 1 n=1 Tax=Lingula anatina TaxID=7574 RepID=A0A1S3JJ38_LINAN|nr:subtilisin-like protease 1 [Lingula anatina]|eukprot:XP_013410141.1 subtilisin-like protease 1 [Lingula anatina]